MCVLEEGARTVWTVHETLRKAYQITSDSAGAPRSPARGSCRSGSTAPDAPAPAPPLTGDATCDLAIVGGGFTGLWAAILAKQDDPGRDVVVLEGEPGRLRRQRPQRGFRATRR